MTPAHAGRIAALAPVQVDISLLGATPETSDAVMGRKNTLPRILRGVKLLQERGARVKLNTLLLDLNIVERQQIVDMALELGVYYEQVFKVSPADNGTYEATGRQLSLAQMADVLVADRTPFVRQAPISGTRTCGVGLSSCLIDPYGRVYPCVELRAPAGNLRRQRFAEIWADASIFQQLRAQHVYSNLPDCRACPISAWCEGRCAGLAWKESGDPYLGHALACRHAQARYMQQHPGEAIPQTPAQARLLAGL
jgi:radical SAM protein with 4Fe4S-binding SPASM domain